VGLGKLTFYAFINDIHLSITTTCVVSAVVRVVGHLFLAFLSFLFVFLLIFLANSLLKQQSTQLPAIKAVILQEKI
jgi:cell division protein FtsB